MFRLGAHVSISDGFEAAVDQAAELGGNCGQIFVGSPRGWAVSEVDESEADSFRDAADEQDVGPWIVHGTYLINLTTPNDDLARRSIDCVQAELDAAATLDIPYYVFHPGAHTGAGEETGIENVGERLSEVDIPCDVTLLLENTAGKGTTVGKRLEALDDMVELSAYEYGDVGVCLDTCHLFAAGYDFTDEAAMNALVEAVDSTVGIDNVQYLHLNDSKHPLGSEKDEHEHIGEGKIGEAGFRQFVNHEAPSGETDGTGDPRGRERLRVEHRDDTGVSDRRLRRPSHRRLVRRGSVPHPRRQSGLLGRRDAPFAHVHSRISPGPTSSVT